jgi:hypothetical protein
MNETVARQQSRGKSLYMFVSRLLSLSPSNSTLATFCFISPTSDTTPKDASEGDYCYTETRYGFIVGQSFQSIQEECLT